jgi:hypothetical protein
MPKDIKTGFAPPSKNILKEPEPQAEPTIKCPVEGCTFTTKNQFALNKHLDSIHHAQPPPVTDVTTVAMPEYRESE